MRQLVEKIEGKYKFYRKYGRSDVDYDSFYSDKAKSLALSHSRAELLKLHSKADSTASKYLDARHRDIEQNKSHRMQSIQAGYAAGSYRDEAFDLESAIEIYELFPEYTKEGKGEKIGDSGKVISSIPGSKSGVFSYPDPVKGTRAYDLYTRLGGKSYASKNKVTHVSQLPSYGSNKNGTLILYFGDSEDGPRITIYIYGEYKQLSGDVSDRAQVSVYSEKIKKSKGNTLRVKEQNVNIPDIEKHLSAMIAKYF